MRERLLTIILVTLACAFPAAADPTIKVINFTANWCPVCRMLDPRLHDAVQRLEDRGAILVNLDQTHLTRRDDIANTAVKARLHQLTASHNVAYLWDWYGGHAGIAVIVAADNGEPLTCISSALTTKQIADLLQESIVLATRVRAGARRPKGTNCPPPKKAGAIDALIP